LNYPFKRFVKSNSLPLLDVKNPHQHKVGVFNWGIANDRVA